MKLPTETRTQREENLIPLINIVFLILIFFLVAATIRPFTANDITPANSSIAEKSEPINFSLMVDKTGAIKFNGQTTTVEELIGNAVSEPEKPVLTIVADKELAASRLLTIVAALDAEKFTSINLVTREAAE